MHIGVAYKACAYNLVVLLLSPTRLADPVEITLVLVRDGDK